MSGKYEMLKEAASTYGKSVRRKNNSILTSAQDVVVSRKPHLQDLPIPHNLKQAAFAHLFLSNDSPDDHELHSLTEALNATQSILAHQDVPGTAHRNASSKVVQLENGILLLQSALSPIRRIPQEILQCIFGIHLPKPNTVFPQQYIPAGEMLWSWTLSQVCRTWRLVALSTPELWNHQPRLQLQPFTSPGDCRRQQEQLEFMIEQSKDLPLHFFLASETHRLSIEQRPILDLLITHAERWGSIVICVHLSILAGFNGVKGRLSRLHRLSLSLSWSPSTVDLHIFSVAPQLQDVFLNGQHHDLHLPTSAQLVHYEAILDFMTPGIGHAASSASTLQTLILQGTSLSHLEEMTTLPNLKQFSFRFSSDNVHPGALDQLVLPALEELVICGDHQQILATTLSLVARSASAAKQLPFPLKKIHLPAFGAAAFVSDDPATFLSILELSPSLQTLEMSLPPLQVLQRLEKVDCDEMIAPDLECLEFIILTPPSSDQISALNRLATARCEMSVSDHSTKACNVLKALTLYDEHNYSSEARMMRCHRRLENEYHKSEPSEPTIARTRSIGSSCSGSAESFGDPFINMPHSPVDVLRDIIVPVAETSGKHGVPIADAYIFKYHISKQQVGEIISQLERCRGANLNVTDINVSRIDRVLSTLLLRLQNTSHKIINRHSHLRDLQEALRDTLSSWFAAIDDQFSDVHWVLGDETPESESVLLCYVPQHHAIRLTEERRVLVLDLQGRRVAFLKEHEDLCETLRVSPRLRTYPQY